MPALLKDRPGAQLDGSPFREPPTRLAALQLGRRLSFDEPHAVKVASLSLQIFDATFALHGLDDAKRRLLEIAALLHDIGASIESRGHHKHSHDLIAGAPWAGVSRARIAVIANVARYHRKAEPKLGHTPYAALDADDRITVWKLASILRLADAMDKEHRAKVRWVNIRVVDREILLGLNGFGDLMLEEWAVLSKAAMFEHVFGVKVRTEILGGGS